MIVICLQIAQCKAHISELNMHAEAQAREYKQKVNYFADKIFLDPISLKAGEHRLFIFLSYN